MAFITKRSMPSEWFALCLSEGRRFPQLRQNAHRRAIRTFELLEARTLLSTLDLTGGVLTYTDSAGSTSNVRISRTSTDVLLITDSAQTIALSSEAIKDGFSDITSPGATRSTVAGPLSVVESMQIDTSGGDALTIDFSGGDPVPPSGVSFDPAAASNGAVNTLTLEGGATASAFPSVNLSEPGVIRLGPGNVPVSYSNTESVKIIKPAAAPVGTAATFNATAGLAITDAVVATFTDSDPAVRADSFVASIQWSDGTSSSGGTILQNGAPDAQGISHFDVKGDHLYARSGTYPVNVTVTNLGSTWSTVLGTTAITVVTQGPVDASPAPIQSSIKVFDAMLVAQGTTIHPVEGTAFTGIVATFRSFNPNATLTDFTKVPGGITVAWGDGTTDNTSRADSTLVVKLVGFTPNGVAFTISGKHVYTDEGARQVVATIHSAFGSEAVALTDAQVGDAPLKPAATQPNVAPSNAVRFTGRIAAFTDLNAGAAARDFRAIIYWGDGSPATAGAITETAAGKFSVSGAHLYSSKTKKGSVANFLVKVYVTDSGGSTVNLTNTAHVSNAVGPSVRRPALNRLARRTIHGNQATLHQRIARELANRPRP